MFRRALCATTLLVLVVAPPALAQIDPDPDGIGLYFDPEAMVNQVNEGGGIVTGHICLTNPATSAIIEGCELSLDWEVQGGALILLGIAYPFVILDPPAPPDIRWESETGLPSAPVVILAWVDMFFIPPGPVYFRIGPYSEPEGGILGNYLPAYRAADDPEWRPMIPSSGSIDEPVASINGDPPVGAESSAWSEIKELYR